MNAGVKISNAVPRPNACATHPASMKRGPPMATLFMLIIDKVVTLGSGLKCMAPTQNPPQKESNNRLRRSLRRALALRRVS
jgi:hypothetical protein